MSAAQEGTAQQGRAETMTVHGGMVVLDIGGDVGALVVLLPDALAGTEVEIGPAGSTQPCGHTGVHPRTAPNGTTCQTAVYPQLSAGTYQLWHPDHPGAPLGPVVQVHGGQVSQLDLQAAPQGELAPR